jgi:hypothetical protein
MMESFDLPKQASGRKKEKKKRKECRKEGRKEGRNLEASY